MAEQIVGLDIGTTKVRAVIAEVNEQGYIEVVGVGSVVSQGLRRGVVINIEAALKVVHQAIEAAEMMSGQEVSGLVIGIAGAHIEGINSRGVVAVTGKGREITREDISRVIDAAKAIVIPMDREVLHVIPQEFIIDDQGGIKNPLDMIGIRLEAEVHIITGSVTSAQNLLKCVNRAGFRVQDIVLESLASSRAVLSDDEMELGVLLIDMGGGTTDILVHLEGAPYHTDVVALGGSQVTSDISIVLKTPIDSAEKIKIDYGCCYLSLIGDDEEVRIPGVGGWPAVSIPRQELCKIIQPRMAEIFMLVREQIIRKDYLKHLGGGVVLTGGNSLMPGACELACDIFGVPVRLGVPDRIGGIAPEYKNPAFATAMGLLMYAADSIEGKVAPSPVRKPGGSFDKLKQWMKEFF